MASIMHASKFVSRTSCRSPQPARWRSHVAAVVVDGRVGLGAPAVDYTRVDVNTLANQIKEAEEHFKTIFSQPPMPSEAAAKAPAEQRDRRMLIEVEKSIQRHSSDQSFEISLVKLENENLMAEVTALKARKVQLLELAYAKDVFERPEDKEEAVTPSQYVDPLEAALAQMKK
eukprot:gene24215-9814_t